MNIINYIRNLIKPAKWYYCQLEDGKITYADSPVFWHRWAKKHNPIVDSTEGFCGDIQVAVMIEFRGCDLRFARTKEPAWDRDFYRVTVLGGPLDGSTKEVRTLKEAEALMTEWSQASLP